MNAIDRLIRSLQSSNESCREDIEKFTAQLAKNPVYGFEWAESAMRAAATLQVQEFALSILTAPAEEFREGEAPITLLVKQLQRDVMHAARYPSRSTSQMTNLMHQETMSVKASLIERILSL